MLLTSCHTRSRRLSTAALSFALVLLFPIAAWAQEGVIQRAHALRNAGDFAGAAQLLQGDLSARPDDAEVARLLAQTLYWLHDVDGARAVYEAALLRRPSDSSTGLAYGRMLMETGASARARALLTPLSSATSARTRAEACTLLGTLAYWQGDFTAAKRFFLEALRSQPAQEDARRQLREILLVSAPWLHVSPSVFHDDQPLGRVSAVFEAGWFATPLVPISVRVEPMRYLSGGETRRFWMGEATIGHYAPARHIETEAAGGLFHVAEAPERQLHWNARAMVGVRLPQHVTVRARVDRAPYLHTVASIDRPFVTNGTAAELHWNDPRGWTGQAAYRRQWYPDGNVARSAHAWVLAPIAHGRSADLRVGYAFSADHARESRFVSALLTQPPLSGDAGSVVAGRYDPYYTPAHRVTHSAIAGVTLRASAHATLRLGGAYAVRAREEMAHEESPWNVRGSLEFAPTDDLSVSLSGETGRAAFYRWAVGGLSVTYRFRAAARRRTDGQP